MNNVVEHFQKGNFVVEILQDEDAENPLEFHDNLWTMIFWHKRYDMGHKHNFSIDEFETFRKKEKMLCFPVYAYDHSGISISVNRNYPYNCPWDSGQLGYIYVTYKKLWDEYRKKKISKTTIEKAIKIMHGEIETYNDFLTGNCYVLHYVNGDDDNYIGGFYGTDYEKNGMLECIPVEFKDIFQYHDSIENVLNDYANS